MNRWQQRAREEPVALDARDLEFLRDVFEELKHDFGGLGPEAQRVADKIEAILKTAY